MTPTRHGSLNRRKSGKGAVNSFTRLEPEDNGIVLFPSRCFHEVTTVECGPDDFGAGRFSLNGALRKLRADGR